MKVFLIKSLLLTRTHEENEFLKKYFKKKDININLISAPLLEIEFKKKLIPLTKYNIFIFTSSYAVKAIKNIKTLKKNMLSVLEVKPQVKLKN